MYRNLMIKGYADRFNVNVLCTDACVWLHTLIYMIKRNPPKIQNPALYEDHALSNTWRLLKHTLKKKQSKLRFSRYMYTNMLAFQGFFLFVLKLHESNISGMYEATSTFYFTQYVILWYTYISLCIFHIITSKRIA